MFRFQAEFFKEKESHPVKEFLELLPKKAMEKVLRFIDVLEEKGFQMPRQYCKKLTHSDLWELIIDHGTNTYRIFFFYYGKTIVLLHGIQKKTEETPRADIELAEKRMKEWLKRKRE